MNLEAVLAAEQHLLASSRTRADVYTSAHRAARRLLPLDAFYVCLYEPKNRRLSFEYNGDEDGLDTPEAFPLGSGPTSRAIVSGKTHVLNHLHDASVSTIAFGDLGRRSRGAIHLPFWDGSPGGAGGKAPLGVVSVQSYTLDAYDRRQVETLRWLGARTVHLLRETEKETAREAARIADAEAARERLLLEMQAVLDHHKACPALREALLVGLRNETAVAPTLSLASLTDREIQALALVAQGLSYVRAADVMGIGMESVKTHLRRAYAKTDLANGRTLARHLSTLLAEIAARRI